ncbi:MAG: hypothetical protein VB934_14865 [Polyangiaceae bacterium]
MNKHLLLAAAAVALLNGCVDPIVGEWDNDDNNSSFDDSLTLSSDGTGIRKTELTQQVEGQQLTLTIEYAISWEVMTDNDYEAELDCDDASIKIGSRTLSSGCSAVANDLKRSGFDFDSECTLNNDADLLKCQPEGSDTKIKYERKF